MNPIKNKIASSVFLQSFALLFVLVSMPSWSYSQLKEWPKMQMMELTEIRTVSDKILVAYFLGPDVNNANTNAADWRVNGKQPSAINKWITPNWEGTDFGYEHHIYLTLDEPLRERKTYHLKTPHGDTTFVFNSKQIFCESIKTNQSAYSSLSRVRYANLSIWTGTGGGRKIQGELPKYQVVDIDSGKEVCSGVLEELGENPNSGDFVYRMDLSEVSRGGPYKVVVSGYGSSYPFVVGGQNAKRLAYTAFRGLLHQRCGIEQMQPYFDYNIREKCHPTVYVTNSPPKEAKVEISPNDKIIKTYGGYHDAGDADRRDHHMISSMVLLTYYDMFPDYFSDNQYNIPDIFNDNYEPVGQNNGIPDIIDEAEWGTLIFELLQEASGGVRSGTERTGYPADSVGLDKDTDQYATFRVDKNATTLAAGLFAHLARAIKPFDKGRSDELQKRAEKAWGFAGDSALVSHKLYFMIQYYLLTGDENTHRKLINLAPEIARYKDSFQSNPRKLNRNDEMLGAHFFSYVVQNDRPKNKKLVKTIEEAIQKAAEIQLGELQKNPWPNGTSNPNRWWGSQTAQGQYADPLLMMWRLTSEQKYIDAVSQLMDYNLGLNPLGKSYLTGTGFDRVEDPLHHDSYPMKEKGWGPAPGLLVFGPGNIGQLKENCPPMIPAIETLPAQRQYLDNRRNVTANEFTIPESLTYPPVIYTILSGGGKWDRKTDLNEVNLKAKNMEIRKKPLQSISQRENEVDDKFIDLTSFYNFAIGEEIHDKPRNTIPVEPGLSDFKGVKFDVRGIVQLAGSVSYEKTHIRFPKLISGIPIKQKAKELCFLHSSAWESKPGTEVATIVINYADNQKKTIIIRNKREVEDWWFQPQSSISPPHAKVAWEGSNNRVKELDFSLKLYRFSWKNPLPDVEIESVDLLSTMNGTAYMLYGITCL